MFFQLGLALLDAVVLANLHHEDMYGYKLTQETRRVVRGVGVNLVSGIKKTFKRVVS